MDADSYAGGTVEIGPLKYPVKFVERIFSETDPEEELAGNIRYAECDILVKRDMSPQATRFTIVHESFHGVLDHMGHHDVPEHIVDALTFGALMLIDANPWLFRKWRRKDGQNCQE